MATLTFEQARQCVLAKLREANSTPAVEQISLSEAAGRVLAEPVRADRDYPPASRSVRDGFAVRAADVPGDLLVVGEVRAGESFAGEIKAGEALEIMTGAPVPRGADSVVMIEHCTLADSRVHVPRTLTAGENVSLHASQARANDVLLEAGHRLGFADCALLAMVGAPEVQVFARPKVAILATGDEIVEVEDTPLDYQVRNSNVQSLAVQVRSAGGCPTILPVARDVYGHTRELIERGLRFDMLLLSGGVSAGKYDIVERVLADLGAEFYFDRVLIMPGQPLVFGRVHGGQAHGKFFFGLPGNPASTMVTFEIFARSAVELLGGQSESMLPITWAKLERDFRQKPGLTRFLPATLSSHGTVTPLPWQGSGDVPALARANAFVVTDPEREAWPAGDWIRVLLK
ncbi:MAG TPA: gephyrin-like molybdotransferase Glp [Bryobacteraceae bacterium]|nr:gephyrin-like molybdotransferase Glp [Bryobacteraceae bacterium]